MGEKADNWTDYPDFVGGLHESQRGTDKTVKELLERYLRDHAAPNNAPKSY